MKTAFSDRDKRMLWILLLFFAALGYYYLILIPLQNISGASARELNAKRTALKIKQLNISRSGSWQSSRKRLGERIAGICKAVKAPFMEVPVPERIEAITRAASQSGVFLQNIKPVSVSPSGDGPKVINKFIVDGNCSFETFLKFIHELYGMKFEQFTLSLRDSKEGPPLRFYLVLESLHKVKLDFPSLAKLNFNIGDYKMKHNLFTLKHTPEELAKRPPTPEEIKKKKEEALRQRLEGVKFEGTARLNDVLVAIISDNADTKVSFRCCRPDDKIRGVGIASVSDKEVKFIDSEGIACVMCLSEL
ncbi:MAG: hypothetical protein A2017_11680 [Lentisphaerae bacterium GWF2_44_16]|nr:MAG: hypothetical protein A2017_11680 [Lentisphaerae bacterium GWF2_44_16]